MLYLLRHGDTRYHKLGYSRDVDARVRALQIGTPIPLVLVHVSAGGYAAESVLHEELAEYRVRPEWFDLPPDIVPVVCAAMNAALEYARGAEQQRARARERARVYGPSPAQGKRKRRTKYEMEMARRALPTPRTCWPD